MLFDELDLDEQLEKAAHPENFDPLIDDDLEDFKDEDIISHKAFNEVEE